MLSDRVPSRQISHGLDEKAGLISLKVSDVLMLAGNVRTGPSLWPGRVPIIAGVRAGQFGAASHSTGTRSQAYRGAAAWPGRIEASCVGRFDSNWSALRPRANPCRTVGSRLRAAAGQSGRLSSRVSCARRGRGEAIGPRSPGPVLVARFERCTFRTCRGPAGAWRRR